jgi:hypothetical protein
MESVTYETTDTLDVSELAEFYARQEHRPVVSADKLARMIEKSDCLVTARRDGRLIGIARGLGDGVYGHLAECKLDPCCQGPAAVTRKDGRIEHDREGIACEMASRVIDALRELGVEEIHVLAYGTEVDFCEDLGFKKIGGTVALRMEVAADVPVEAVAQ